MHTITLSGSGLYEASRHCLPAVLPGLESKVSTLVEGIARSFEELGEDGRRHPRLAREISALDRLVTAT